LPKPFPFGTTFNSSWLNPYLSPKPFPFGITFNSLWLNLYFLLKLSFLHG
jgi:hypothetical protein